MEGDARQIASTAEDSANSRSCCVLWRFSSEVVGATGFEPATPCAQGRCATRLRYAPTLKNLNFTAVFCSPLPRALRLPAKLSQNSGRLSQNTPDSSSRLFQNSRRLVAPRLSFCNALHLRVLLEHLRVAL